MRDLVSPVAPAAVSLRDASQAFVRPITPDDKAELQAGLDRLSTESRYRRFFSSVTELRPDQLRYLTELDYRAHFAWGAYTAYGEHPGIGVSRYICLSDRPHVADLAVAILDDFHGVGLGRVLVEATVIAAAHNGVETIVASVLRENSPMLAVFRHMEPTLVTGEGGAVEVEIDVAGQAARLGGSLYDDFRRIAEQVAPADTDAPQDRAGGAGIEPATSGIKTRRSAN